MALPLLSFPNEILIHIISRIFNADLDNFTSTCKIIRALSAGTLREHRTRQKGFRHITYGRQYSPDRDSATWVHPTLMLRDLIHNDLLCYPVVLSLNKTNDDNTASDPDVDHGLRSLAKEVEPLIEMCTCFRGDEALSRGVLKEGDIGATLGLLLNVLPNLRDLKIIHYRERSPGNGSLKRILDRILTTTQNTPRGSIPCPSKLESVIFRRFDRVLNMADNETLSTYTPLFYLPSMRSICVDGTNTEESWAYPGVQSNINRLEIRELHTSTIKHDSLRAYLKTTQNLLQFKYVAIYANMAYDASRSQVKEIAQTVLEQAGHSLHYLYLTCWFINCGPDCVPLARAGGLFIGSLKAFRVLEGIQVGASMLVEPVETRDRILTDPVSARSGRVQRLIDILPSSIVGLLVIDEPRVTGSGNGVDIGAMLEGLPESKADLLPYLRGVTFKSDRPSQTVINSNLLDGCKEAGVKIDFFENREGMFTW